MAKIKVDFSTTEESGSFDIPNGKYLVRVKETEMGEGDKAPYILWHLEIAKGEKKGLTIRHFTTLSPKALFSLRDFLVALGVKVPKGAVSIDPDAFVGKTLVVETGTRKVDDNEYPTVKKVFPATESTSTKRAETVTTAEPSLDDLDVDLELELD